MNRLLGGFLACAALVGASGCYHATVVTGQPESPRVVNRPWALSFVYGLVPPATVNTASECPQGVAKVETQHSFLNMAVGFLTGGLVYPMTITVTCAASSNVGQSLVQPDGSTVAEVVGEAARLSASTEAPVFVRLAP